MRAVGGFTERITQRLRLPEELLDDGARLTLTAGRQARIENHRGLLCYAPDAMTVGCGKQRLCIRGESLRIAVMTPHELLVEGRILSVEVEGA